MDLTAIELHEPVGWVSVSLTNPESNIPCPKLGVDGPLRTHFLQIRMLSMHQNGRDAHIRQIKILGPRSSPKVMGDCTLDQFKSISMLQYATLR